MECILKKVSDHKFEKVIKVNTLEDLKAISKEYYDPNIGFGEEEYVGLVIYFENNTMPLITIYDDYIE